MISYFDCYGDVLIVAEVRGSSLADEAAWVNSSNSSSSSRGSRGARGHDRLKLSNAN